jgi:signal transduction histidine kinase
MMETFDLTEALQMPIRCVSNLQTAGYIVVTPLPEAMCPFLISDKHWLCENVLCLLSNAVKYSDGGRVDVITELMPLSELTLVEGKGTTKDGSGKAAEELQGQQRQGQQQEKQQQEKPQQQQQQQHGLGQPSTSPVAAGQPASTLATSSSVPTATSPASSTSPTTSAPIRIRESPHPQAGPPPPQPPLPPPLVVKITIMDTGIGMSEEARKTLFQVGNDGLSLLSYARTLSAFA